MAWIIRLILIIAAPIAALLVARGTVKFDIFQTFVGVILIAVCLIVGAVWSLWRLSDRG